MDVLKLTFSLPWSVPDGLPVTCQVRILLRMFRPECLKELSSLLSLYLLLQSLVLLCNHRILLCLRLSISFLRILTGKLSLRLISFRGYIRSMRFLDHILLHIMFRILPALMHIHHHKVQPVLRISLFLFLFWMLFQVLRLLLRQFLMRMLMPCLMPYLLHPVLLLLNKVFLFLPDILNVLYDQVPLVLPLLRLHPLVD